MKVFVFLIEQGRAMSFYHCILHRELILCHSQYTLYWAYGALCFITALILCPSSSMLTIYCQTNMATMHGIINSTLIEHGAMGSVKVNCAPWAQQHCFNRVMRTMGSVTVLSPSIHWNESHMLLNLQDNWVYVCMHNNWALPITWKADYLRSITNFVLFCVSVPSKPVPCPFQGYYSFKYSNSTTHNRQCSSPLSEIRACADDSKFKFVYRKCPGMPETSDKGIKLIFQISVFSLKISSLFLYYML